MMEEQIKNVLNYSKNAPSGDNSQPWRFIINNSKVSIINISDADNPILNINQRGSLIAHGALIQNILISAPSFGLEAKLHLFEKIQEGNVVAEMTFSPISNKATSELFDSISRRSTNRNKYQRSISKKLINYFEDTADIPNTSVLLRTTVENISKLSKALSTAEYIFLHTKELHRLLFQDIVWNEEQEKEKCRGLYLNTLELDPIAKKIFPLLKHWWVMRFFNVFNLPQKVAVENAKTYSSSAAIGAIFIPDNDMQFVNAGRALEQLWLKCEKEGYALQPLNGLLFLSARIKNSEELLTEKNAFTVRAAAKDIFDIFHPPKNLTIGCIFRIGVPIKPPSAFSSKVPIDSLIINTEV